MTTDTVTHHDEPLMSHEANLAAEESGASAMFVARFHRDWSAFEDRIIGVKRSESERSDESSPDDSTNDCRAYWSDLLGYISDGDAGLVSLGERIVSDLDLDPPRETLKRILGLNQIDGLTALAANTALFTVFNTSTYGVDMDDVALGIAAYIHCYAALRSEGPEIELAERPFGDDTIWKPATIPHP